MLGEMFLIAALMGDKVQAEMQERMKVAQINELMNESENLRRVEEAWSRFWIDYQATHLTPDRTDGSVR